MRWFNLNWVAWGLIGLLSLLVGLVVHPAMAEQVLYLSVKGAQEIRVYDMDGQSGQLSLKQRVQTPGPIGAMEVSPDGGRLYGASSSGGIQSFSRDPATGLLTVLNFVATRGNPSYLSVSEDGRFVLASYFKDGGLDGHRTTDEGLDAQAVFDRMTERHAHACILTGTNTVLVPHTTPNRIDQFRFDPANGQITPHPTPSVNGGPAIDPDRTPIQGPRHMAKHPTLDVMYVVNEKDGTVSAYKLDLDDGGLVERFQDIAALPEGFKGKASCADVHVTPDGRFVFASTRAVDAIVGYTVDPVTGRLTLASRTPTVKQPREFEIDGAGRFLYVSGQGAGQLVVYGIDPISGSLEEVERHDVGRQPWWVLVRRLES